MFDRASVEYELGSAEELRVERLLQERGWYVVRAYDYTGQAAQEKAPRMFGPDGQTLILPDLDVSQGGTRRWVEIKAKASASFTRMTQQWEHGIPLRHYQSYLSVQEESGTSVWLFVCEQDSQDVLIQKLDDLPVRVYAGDKMSYGGMAFFPCDSFMRFSP